MYSMEFFAGLEIRGAVTDDPATLAQYQTQNPLLEDTNPPLCVIRPEDTPDLKVLLRSQGPKVVPVSSGGPHRRGGIACDSSHAVVDLSHWDSIPWINRRNRVCIIQPGVTYGQLAEALRPHGMAVPMPLAPRSTKSVLAAVLDREPSTWPNKQWDYQDPVASTEFVFGTGDLFRSGAAGGPGSLEDQRRSKGAQKSPLGPGQSDFQRVVMGSQGSLGVMTWISLRTELAPSVEEPFLVGDGDLSRIIPFFYAVQRPWLGEQAFILNRTAAAMLMSRHQPENFSAIRESLPEYVCLQNIAGFERLPQERLNYQKADIQDMARRNGLELKNRLGDISAPALLQTATTVCGPRDWRHGLLGHCLSVIFLSGLDQTPKHMETFKQALARAGLDETLGGAYFQPVVQNHACHCEFLIPFDPTNPKTIAAMKSLERDLCRTLARTGAFFSRPYGAALEFAFEGNPGHEKLMRLAKRLFDPSGNLHPGKFNLP
ncbi:MAG: FAD-binding oxidoreductase, partial [Desulfatibacillum sp.]|nr:FAD-binding oxidoreductase [Desulfatibacillum sp.]